MFTLVRSSLFNDWLKGLADHKGKARIAARLVSAAHGNFGDCQPVGEGVSEMRIHYGPGYRVYYVRNGAAIYLLLTGGDKGSKRRDIERAKELARDLKEQEP
jgi:putative addiction module killer protein